MNIEVDGKCVKLEGLEPESLVIARPPRLLSEDDFKIFNEKIDKLRPHFTKYGMTVIAVNFDSVTFQVVKG